MHITLGNAIVILDKISNIAEEDEQEAGIDYEKSTYVVLFREGNILKNKIGKVCDIFSSERFEIPEKTEEKKAEIAKRIQETKNLIQITRSEIKRELDDYSKPFEGTEVSKVVFQMWYFEKEKLLYQKMNMLRRENLFLRGICWCPVEDAASVTELLSNIQKTRNGAVAKFMKIEKHPLIPPTYLKVNDFTSPFQDIVSTYGVPSYKEVNPAFFTIITFPFLFGVMFGDVCHGLCLLVFSIYLCSAKDSLIKSKSMLCSALKVRYLFLMMGIFSTFCGLVYNDFAGLNFNFFQTCYEFKLNKQTMHYDIHKTPSCVYPLGIDPFWKYSTKQLQFENSFKMKLSVIFGVLQMATGVMMKLVNSLQFKKKYDVWFEFLPQIIFLIALFGFMDFLIFVKWMTDFGSKTYRAPYIISIIINMFLKFGGVPETDDPLISGQQVISILLFFILFLCVPIMLLVKPLLLKSDNAKSSEK